MKQRRINPKLKETIISEYKEGIVGYKVLAKKYCLRRDTIRSIILSDKESKLHYNKYMEVSKEDLEKTKEKDKLKTLDDYRAAAIYWKTYAELLEKEIDSNAKKNCNSKQ